MVEQSNSDRLLRLADLKPAMKLEGRVTKIELFGAFIDVGAEREGMVHISMLQRGHLSRVEDVVQEGQQVEVWVHKVDPHVGRLELTMIKPVQLKWKDITPGIQVKGKVVRLEKFGAFVDIGAERPGLVHVSELSPEYVTNPAEVVNVGDEVNLKVIDFDRKKRQIRLSMKEMVFDTEEEEKIIEEIPTAMEVALRQALQQSDEEQHEAPVEKDLFQEKKKRELEDILNRTLKQRVRTSSGD